MAPHAALLAVLVSAGTARHSIVLLQTLTFTLAADGMCAQRLHKGQQGAFLLYSTGPNPESKLQIMPGGQLHSRTDHQAAA